MIRQLGRLVRALPAAGPEARLLAVYAEAADDAFVARAAAEQGFEGVACLDDAARAAGLYCQIWRRHRLPWARDLAYGLLAAVRYFQEPDGRFANFVLDWSGQKNLTGPSSRPGGWAWQARAMHALAQGYATFGQAEDAACFARGLPWLDRPCLYLDVRAVCVLAALDGWAATGRAELAQRALAWADEIASERLGDLLPDAPGRAEVHLWGHLQEAALARTGQAFERPDLVAHAAASAEVVLAPAVERAFAAPTTLPFEVSCAAAGLAALAEATGDRRYVNLASEARAWFGGRNAAQQPVYDRQRGLVHDGIDAGRLNRNSGAESNVEAALALLDDLPWAGYAAGAPPAA